MYTYIQMPLGVPWALYFVFLALVTLPFAVMFLAAGGRARLLRAGLGLAVVTVLAIVAVFVVNAFEATDLMRTEKRAGPTILNR